MAKRTFAVCASLFPAAASAHSFDAGADAFAQVGDGLAVVLTYPAALFPLLSLGLLLGLWCDRQLRMAGMWFVAGQVVGLLTAPLVGSLIDPTALTLGIGVAICATLAPGVSRSFAPMLAAAVGWAAIAVAFVGHGLFELPVTIHAGIIIAVNLLIFSVVGNTRFLTDRFRAAWVKLALRIAASWIAAIQILSLAFMLSA